MHLTRWFNEYSSVRLTLIAAMNISYYLLPRLPLPFSRSFPRSPSSAHSSSATISTGSAVVSMSRRISFNRSTPMKCSAITRERSERTMRSPFRVTSPWLARTSRAGSMVPTMLSLMRSRSASRPRQTTAFATYSSEKNWFLPIEGCLTDSLILVS